MTVGGVIIGIVLSIIGVIICAVCIYTIKEGENEVLVKIKEFLKKLYVTYNQEYQSGSRIDSE